MLIGEVSMVNDDEADNRFLDPIGRFPAIEVDVLPAHLPRADSPRYDRAGQSGLPGRRVPASGGSRRGDLFLQAGEARLALVREALDAGQHPLG